MSSDAPAYRVQDRSILLPFYRRLLVDPFLERIPASIHPNSITHAGHVVNLLGVMILLGTFRTEGWPFVLSALCLQFYMWCDNADGAHARRTKQTSAFGELLDHGLDGLNTVYIGLSTAMALGVSPDWWVVFALIIPGAAAFTYWEQSQTGIFQLGMLNQVESLTVLCGTLLVSAFFGQRIWTDLSFHGVSLQLAIELWALTTILFGMLRGTYRVARSGKASVLPALVLVAHGIGVFAAHSVGAVGTVQAVVLATAANVYFATRMLRLRLERATALPDPRLSLFAFLLGGVCLASLLGVHIPEGTGTVIAGLSCAVLGLSAALDARAGAHCLARTPA